MITAEEARQMAGMQYLEAEIRAAAEAGKYTCGPYALSAHIIDHLRSAGFRLTRPETVGWPNNRYHIEW